MNVLNYTTATPNPCKESLNIRPGSSCLSKNIIKKLYPLEKELNKNNDRPIPVIRDEELLPSDGSSDSKMIRRLAYALDCDSEYCILKSEKVKDTLTQKEIKDEKDRFKTHGPRLKNVGTDGEKHAYNILLKWAEVFDFFYPLPHIIYRKDDNKNLLDADKVMKIIRSNYPNIRVIAADISIIVEEKKLCIGMGHSIVVLIDIRGDTFEEWTIEFFDSIGQPPPTILTPFLVKLSRELKKFREELNQSGPVYIIPTTKMLRHQTTPTECGMHSLIFIRRRLEGISYRAFSKYKIPDVFAKEFRRDVFIV